MIKTLLAFLGVLVLVAQAGTASWSSNTFFEKPNLGTQGAEQNKKIDLGLFDGDTRPGHEKWLNDPAYGGNLRTAITALGSTYTVLNVPTCTWIISEDLIVPANITLKLVHGAVLSISNGATLYINGFVEAGPYQIFSCRGTGKVVFGSGSILEALPQWWYDGRGDWSVALQKAADSIAQVGRASRGGANRNTGGVIRLLSGAYTLHSTVVLYEAMSVLGAGMESTRLTYTGSGPAFQFSGHSGANTTGPRFKGFTLCCSGTNACGIKLNDPKIDQLNPAHDTITLYPVVEDILFRGTYTAGVYAVQWTLCYSGNIRNCFFNQFDRMIDLHDCDEPVIEGNRFMGGNVQLALNAGFPIQGLSNTNPCVVSWKEHGLQTGGKIALHAMKQAGWANNNGLGYNAITKIDNDHFSIALDASSYGVYEPATDPGLITYEYFTGSKGRILHNSFMAPHDKALAFIISGDRCVTIHDNYFENYGSWGTTDYIIKFLTGQSIRVKDNRLSVGTGATTLGSFDFSTVIWNQGAPALLQVTGNNDGLTGGYDLSPCTFPHINTYYFYYSKKVWGGHRRKIIHYGNAQVIDDSFPFNSKDRQTWTGTTAFVGSPDLPGLANTGAAAVTEIYPNGAFRLRPKAAKNGSLLNWPNTGVNGTVSIAIEAKAGLNKQELQVERSNGAVSQAAATQALTTDWAWYKVFTGVTVTNLSINVWNEDTVHNTPVFLRRVVVTYD